MNLVYVSKLKLGFDKNITISDATFEIKSGDFVCIVGANGSGKTTLVKAILGLVRPFSGTIKFGDEISAKEIGYLPQELELDSNFPALVNEVVLSGCLSKMHLKICYGKVEKQKMRETLKLLGISNLESKSFSELSGGQKQKVLLARALVNEPRLLILDEPSNNLDYKSKKEFYKILSDLNQKKNVTIMMVTHDLDSEDLIGNKIIAIENGRAKLYTTREYLRRFKA